MDMTRRLFCGLVQACPVDALAMTREYEWTVYDERNLFLNKRQLVAIGERAFQAREKLLEFQHPESSVLQCRLNKPAIQGVLAAWEGGLT